MKVEDRLYTEIDGSSLHIKIHPQNTKSAHLGIFFIILEILSFCF